MRAADGEGTGALLDPEALLGRYAGERVIALAVSGGADSLALMLIAARWRQGLGEGPRLLVLSVDHGLRAEAAAEVETVGRLARGLGLDFQALRADWQSPEADIEAEARAMRYRLLAEAARAAGAHVLMTAHHADDQAETLLLRLGRGSGVYGLSAMAAETLAAESGVGEGRGMGEGKGLRIARPLLALRRADLSAYVRQADLVAVDDPHNADRRFARARMRQLMPLLAAEGLDVPRLTATAARLGRAAAAIDIYVDRLLTAAASVDGTGALRLEATPFAGEPEETRLRALARILRAVGGAAYVPRLESLAQLAAAMAEETPFRRTLAGVVVDRRKGLFGFQREAGRDGLPEISLGIGAFEGVYDRRFRVTADLPHAGYRIAALGEAGRRSLAACLPEGLPLAIAATPALFFGEEIVAAPLLGRPSRTTEVRIAIEPIVAARLMMARAGDDL